MPITATQPAGEKDVAGRETKTLRGQQGRTEIAPRLGNNACVTTETTMQQRNKCIPFGMDSDESLCKGAGAENILFFLPLAQSLVLILS